MDVLHFHPAVDDILSFVVFQAVTVRVTYRSPRDVLTNATEDEEEDIPTSREPDDLDFASFYIRRQTGLGGTIYAELQTLPCTFRVGYRAFCCVPYVRVRAQPFRPVRILLMLATSRWFLRRCFALGYTSPSFVDASLLKIFLTSLMGRLIVRFIAPMMWFFNFNAVMIEPLHGSMKPVRSH